MEYQEKPISLSNLFWRYFTIVRKWVWLIVLCVILAGGVAFFYSRSLAPVYQSRTRLLINEAPAVKPNDYNAILSSERQARTYAQMLTDRPLLESIIQDLDTDIRPNQLAASINVELVRDTRLIDVTVEDTDPVRAARIANLLAEKFILQLETLEKTRFQASKANLEEQMALMAEQILSTTAAISALGEEGDAVERDRLETALTQYRQINASLVQSYEAVRLAEASTTTNVVQTVPAIAEEVAVRPNVLFNMGVGALAGGLLAILVIFILEALDDTIRTPDDIGRVLGLSVIGYITDLPANGEIGAGKGGLQVFKEPRSPITDAFRALRANLEFSGVDKPLRTILVTSANPGDGKTTIATNLAAIYSQGGKRVILLDADLRKPNIHRMLDISNQSGLTDLLKDELNFQEVGVTLNGSKDLTVITSGTLPPNPTELLASEKMGRVLEALKEKSNIIVIDSTPCIVADAQILAARVDGVLLVVKPGKTQSGAARAMLEQFNRAGARVMGVVMNRIPTNSRYYGGYHYYAPYHDDTVSDTPKKPAAGKMTSLFSRWLKSKT